MDKDLNERHQAALAALEAGQFAAAEQQWLELLYDLPNAHAWLGRMEEEGLGRKPNLAEAFAWYQKGAKRGDAESAFRLGNFFHEGRYVSRDLAAAFSWWHKAKKNGSADAAKALDQWLAQEEEEAAQPQLQPPAAPATEGDHAALVDVRPELGMAGTALPEKSESTAGSHSDHRDSTSFLSKIRSFFRPSPRSATAEPDAPGSATLDGQHALAVMAMKTGDEAVSLRIWRGQAAQGNARAKSYLGYLNEQGLGVPENTPEAARLYREAALQGYALAAYRLASLCYQGAGVEKSATEAVIWWRQSAESGHAESQFNLGEMLFDGDGIAQDKAAGIAMLTEAALQDHAQASFRLADLYEQGTKVEQDHEKAARFALCAANHGNALAQAMLGDFYEEGKGVEQSDEQALYWYSKAAENENDEVGEVVASLRRKLHGTTTLQFIDELIQEGTTLAKVQFLGDAGVFWVDWKEEETSIVEACESRLQTGTLTWSWEDAEDDSVGTMYIDYQGDRNKVPLTSDLGITFTSPFARSTEPWRRITKSAFVLIRMEVTLWLLSRFPS